MTKCPACESEKSKVKQTKHPEGYTLRVRLCEECGTFFETAEAVIGIKQDD